MTPEETKAAAEVMMAAEYDEDGDCLNVERLHGDGAWRACASPIWSWSVIEYRIKPKPEYRYCNVYTNRVGVSSNTSVLDSRHTATGQETDRLRFEIIDGKLANPVLIGLEADE